MIEGVYTNLNYSLEFLENLQEQLSSKIALLSSKKSSYRKYDLNKDVDNNDILYLEEYKEILDGVVRCSECYEDYKVEGIVNQVKIRLNN